MEPTPSVDNIAFENGKLVILGPLCSKRGVHARRDRNDVDHEEEGEESHLCRVPCQIKIP